MLSMPVQGTGHSMECMHMSLESSAQPHEEFLPLGDSLSQAGRAAQRPFTGEFGSLSEIENCTFKPAIRPSSQARTPRSWESMSRGDYMRKQLTIERTRQQQEELLKATHTFEPVLHTPSSPMLASTQGRLMPTDPNFTMRMTHKDKARESEALRARCEREVGTSGTL